MKIFNNIILLAFALVIGCADIEQQTNEPIFPPQKPHWIPSGGRASIIAHSVEWLRPKSGGSRNALRTSAVAIGLASSSLYTQQTSETSRFV